MRSPRSINDGLLRRALTALEPQTPLDPGHLRQHSFLINNLCSGNRLDEIYEELAALKDHDDPWLARAASTMLAGSPGSVRLSFALQQRMRLRSLDDVFRAEYIAALACAAHGDFAEGIRALLIDKDKRPRWNLRCWTWPRTPGCRSSSTNPGPRASRIRWTTWARKGAEAGERPRPRDAAGPAARHEALNDFPYKHQQ